MGRARAALPGAAYVALAVADSVAAGRSGRSATARRMRYLLKPALVPTLMTAFVAATRAPRSRSGTDVLRAGTVAAQALSWGGDVALLGRGERAFLTGVGSFFGAHVAYVVAFLSVRGERADLDTAGLRAALALWLTGAPLMAAAAGRKDPALRLPVAAYATILSAMLASSRVVGPTVPRGARRTLQAGTALFVLSDSVLAAQEFLLPTPRPALESVVMATYTAGQGLIAAGVARAT